MSLTPHRKSCLTIFGTSMKTATNIGLPVSCKLHCRKPKPANNSNPKKTDPPAAAERQPLICCSRTLPQITSPKYRKSLRQTPQITSPNTANYFAKHRKLFRQTPQITPTKCRKSPQQDSANLLNEMPQICKTERRIFSA